MRSTPPKSEPSICCSRLPKRDEGIAAEALRSLDISYDEILEELKSSATTKGPAEPVAEGGAAVAERSASDAPSADAVADAPDASEEVPADAGSAAADAAGADADAAGSADSSAPAGSARQKLAFTPLVITVMERAFRLARENNQTYVSTEHLLLGMVDEAQCRGMDLLMRLGVTAASVRQAVREAHVQGQGR